MATLKDSFLLYICLIVFCTSLSGADRSPLTQTSFKIIYFDAIHEDTLLAYHNDIKACKKTIKTLKRDEEKACKNTMRTPEAMEQIALIQGSLKLAENNLRRLVSDAEEHVYNGPRDSDCKKTK